MIILLFLTIFTWYKILFQMFMGEGYTYFGKSFFEDLSFADKLVRYEKGTWLIFELLETAFRDNLFLYQLLALFTLMVLGILFYLLVYEITMKKSIAFLSALFFSVSYNGMFEMIAIGNYQFFIQRMIYFLLLFPSALFFVRFLKTRKEKYFLFSVLLYIISLYLSQFSTFFLPFLLSYLFVFLFFTSGTIREKSFLGLRALFFVAPTLIFHYAESQYGGSFLLRGQNFFTFIINESATIIDQIQLQLTVLSVPSQALIFFSKVQESSLRSTIPSLYFPLLLFYIGIALYVISKEKKLRVPVISSFFFIPIVFILNIFTRGSDFIENILPGSRYLFVPSIGFSIILSIFLFVFFSHKSIIPKSVAIVVIVYLVYSNIQAIYSEIDKDFYKHIAAKKSIEYIKNISPKLSSDSFVVVPSVLSYYGAYFCQEFYGKEKTIFMPFFADWHKELKRPFDPKKDYIIDYDFGKGMVVDRAEEHREIIREKSS